jgi:hypothetical protein
MGNYLNNRIVAFFVSLVLIQGGTLLAGEETVPSPGYLSLVRAYADAMITQGRDIYGKQHTPLFVEELDRKTMRMLEAEPLNEAAAIPRSHWGIRPHDRMLGGANPHHCENLFQVLYALTEITGERHYADQSDRSLEYFFQHCQSEETGLLCWGEHAGWDLRTDRRLDKPSGDTHEFYRPWILWERSWKLADQACRRFAVGLWEHQIGDHETGDFSRHAKISSHNPANNAPYARHGGFYIETWAAAYAHTEDDLFLQAIASVLGGLERARLHEGGYLVGGTKQKGSRRTYDISLAVSLHNAANHVPENLAEKMRGVALANDAVFARSENRQTTQPATHVDTGTLWLNAYGGGAQVGRANLLMLRFRQTQHPVYRRAILQEADLYRQREVDLSHPVWPGTLGCAIWLMLDAYELMEEDEYLRAAERFAQNAVDLFVDDNPLPRASHVHEHYEAVTNGDTLMMALLRLWLVNQQPQANINLVYTDR